MLISSFGLQKYIEFCAAKADKDREPNLITGKEEWMMQELNGIKYNYQRIVSELEQIAELQEKINKENSRRINMFHDQKSDAYFANPVPVVKFESTDDMLKQIEETKRKIKDNIKRAELDIKDIKEENGIECAEKAREENKENAPTLLEEYAKSRHDDRLQYSAELANFSRDVVDIQIGVNLEAFESCEQLLEDMKNNKLNLREHSRQAKSIHERDYLLEYMVEYESSYVFCDKSEVEKNGKTIKEDEKYLKDMYDKYSKALNGEATKEDIDSLGNRDYLSKVIKETPKPRWSLRIKNALRQIIGKPGYLMTPEQSIHRNRSTILEGVYEHTTKYVKENHINPKKEKSDFEKSIEAYISKDNSQNRETEEEKKKTTDLVMLKDDKDNDEPEI